MDLGDVGGYRRRHSGHVCRLRVDAMQDHPSTQKLLLRPQAQFLNLGPHLKDENLVYINISFTRINMESIYELDASSQASFPNKRGKKKLDFLTNVILTSGRILFLGNMVEKAVLVPTRSIVYEIWTSDRGSGDS